MALNKAKQIEAFGSRLVSLFTQLSETELRSGGT